MKIFILFAILGMMLFSACTEQDIEPFGERHEVYFYKYFMDEEAPGTAKADSTDVTFFFAKPTDDHVMAEIVVALAGRPLTKDLHFGLKVVKDMTTAIPAGASLILDTIQIRMNRSARLNDLEEGIRLVVEIVPSDELQVGQFERSKAVIHLTKDAVKPEWWTLEVSAGLLGNYSSLKYKTFLENIPGAYSLDGNMIKSAPDEAIKLVKLFKQWLAENPTEDENGLPMSVEV